MQDVETDEAGVRTLLVRDTHGEEPDHPVRNARGDGKPGRAPTDDLQAGDDAVAIARLLQQNACAIDCVSMSRPFIIEPDIVARLQKGQAASRCINCGYCLMGVTSGPLRCYYGKIPRKRESA